MLRHAFLCAALAACLAGRAVACDIALVLAMDVSGSVDAYEYDLQIRGVAAALRDPAVTDALLQGRVALAVVQWSGAGQQMISLPWVHADEPGTVRQTAARIATLPRAFRGGNTAVGEAIDIAAGLFSQVPECARRVIDVSGDGDENEGYTVGTARRNAFSRGIIINGLAIESATTGRAITNFYRRWVITPGGFVITAQRHADFARAIRVKLLRELVTPTAQAPPFHGPGRAAQIDPALVNVARFAGPP